MNNLGLMPATVNFQQAPTGRCDCNQKFRVFLTIISSERLSIGTSTVYVPVGTECGLKPLLSSLALFVTPPGIQVGLWLADRAFCSVTALRWFFTQPDSRVKITSCGNCLVVAKSLGFVSMDDFTWF
jgi:hypothetical protein